MDAKNLDELNQRRRANGEFGNKYHAEAEIDLSIFDRASLVDVATDTDTEPNILAQLATVKDHSVAAALAKNRKTPQTALQTILQGTPRFRGDNAHRIRNLIAANPNAAVQTLRILSTHDEYRDIILTNPGIGEKAADKAAHKLEHDPHARKALATNPVLHLKTQYRLGSEYTEPDWHVRCALAESPTTQTEVLQMMTRDSNLQVRAAARENLKTAREEEAEAIEQYQRDRRNQYLENMFDQAFLEWQAGTWSEEDPNEILTSIKTPATK